MLVINDSIAHKTYTGRIEIRRWHHDYAIGININFLTTVYGTSVNTLLVAFALVKKDEKFMGGKRQAKRIGMVSKNMFK